MEHWELNPSLALNLAVLDPDSFEYRYVIRLGFALHLSHTLRYVIAAGCIKGRPLLKEELPFVRQFISQVDGARVTHAPRDYDDGQEVLREMDKHTDHLMKQMVVLARVWLNSSVNHYGREYRHEAEARHEEERAEKIRKRRERQSQLQQVVSQPREKKTKQIPHREIVLCEKCHKRPVFKSGLCASCYQWERDKLGRE